MHVQYELLKCVGDACTQYHPSLSTPHLGALLDLLLASYEYAATFNKDIALRIALQKAGLLRNLPNQLPSLLRQEVKALSTYLRVCFTVFMHNPVNAYAKNVESRFLEMAVGVLNAYISKEETVASIPMTDRDIVRTEQHRELLAWNEIVAEIIQMLDAMPVDLVTRNLPRFLERLVALMVCDSRAVREVVRDFLLKQVKENRIAVVGAAHP